MPESVPTQFMSVECQPLEDLISDAAAFESNLDNMRKAIVTLTLGTSYSDKWKRYCRNGWECYARRHGYDLITIERPLDDSPRAKARSPAWQKCLILSVPETQGYDRIVWMDSDIAINTESAPCVVSATPEGMVGATDEYATPTSEAYYEALRRKYALWGMDFSLGDTPAAFYRFYGLPEEFTKVVQTGVLVLAPEHRSILEHVYRNYEDKPGTNYEMRPLSYELLRAGCVHFLDPRFNMLWSTVKVLYYPFLWARRRSLPGRVVSRLRRTTGLNWPGRLPKQCAWAALSSCYFLHFAGEGDEIAWAAPNPTKFSRRTQ